MKENLLGNIVKTMSTKAKTIQLLLYDGKLNGVINIADSAWDLGEMYAAPRESVDELVSQSVDKYGVYLLLSSDRVYVGQSSDLEKRVKQHVIGKLWWERVVLLTTKDDSFTRTDIDYMESVLIQKAESAKSLDSDNKNKGNAPKVDKFRKVALDQYLEEALFLMELIGISVFTNPKKRDKLTQTKHTITIAPTNSDENNEKTTNHISKPPLPTNIEKVGLYVKIAMRNLEKSGYLFSDEQIALFGSIEGSKQYTTRNLPLFWILQNGETRDSIKIKDSRVKRYWKDEFKFGQLRFLMYSQWYATEKYGATQKEFDSWYKTL